MGKLDTKIMSLAKTFIPGIAGAIQFWYGEPNPGWGSVSKWAAEGNTNYALNSAITGVTGVRLKHGGQMKTEFDLIGTLNPVDFRNAPVPKVILMSKLAMEGIDMVGKFISGIFRDVVS